MSTETRVKGEHIELVPYDLPGMDESRRYLTVCLGEKVIGFVQMTQVDLNMKKGCFSLELTDESERGKGYGTEAIGLVKIYAGQILGLNLLATIADSEDGIGCHVLEKQGFFCFEERNGCRYYLTGNLS